jgi:hypothetical protein
MELLFGGIAVKRRLYLTNAVNVSDITPCNLIEIFQHFGGTCCPNFQALRNFGIFLPDCTAVILSIVS